jgi:hypothetical protein
VLGKQALEGSISAAQELADRSEGKPHASVSIEESNPLAELVKSMQQESEKVGEPPNESVDDLGKLVQ